MLVMFQLDDLVGSLLPINSSSLRPLLLELSDATRPHHGRNDSGRRRAMTARELRTNVGLVMKLARLYITRSRSLVLQPSAMNVSHLSAYLLTTSDVVG